MAELEQKLRAAMHAAVDHEQPPGDLTARVVRRHRRRTAMLASLSVAASVAVAVAAVTVLPSHGGAPTGPAGGPLPLEPGHPTSKLHGAAMPRGSDVRLLIGGNSRIARYSTATRRATLIAGLPAGLGVYALERLHGGGFLAGLMNPIDPTGRDCCRRPFYYIAADANVGRRIGAPFSVVPSSRADAVWLISYQSFSRHSLGRARLTGLDGRPIGAPVTLPAARTLVLAGIGRYLLLAHSDASVGGPARLWDPVSRRVVRAFREVDAVSPEQIAWGRPCDGCPVHVFDARTGGTSSFAVPPGSQVALGNYSTAAFSPDGTMLAVELTSGIDGPGAAQALRLAVINLATGRMRIVPGVDLTPPGVAGLLNFDWQSGTRRLVLTLPEPANTFQVGYWQPGAARLRVTTARTPRNVVNMVDVVNTYVQ